MTLPANTALRRVGPLASEQIEILKRLVIGENKSSIASAMRVSQSRISQHLASARDRAHAKTTEQLVAIAVKRKWVK